MPRVWSLGGRHFTLHLRRKQPTASRCTQVPISRSVPVPTGNEELRWLYAPELRSHFPASPALSAPSFAVTVGRLRNRPAACHFQRKVRGRTGPHIAPSIEFRWSLLIARKSGSRASARHGRRAPRRLRRRTLTAGINKPRMRNSILVESAGRRSSYVWARLGLLLALGKSLACFHRLSLIMTPDSLSRTGGRIGATLHFLRETVPH